MQWRFWPHLRRRRLQESNCWSMAARSTRTGFHDRELKSRRIARARVEMWRASVVAVLSLASLLVGCAPQGNSRSDGGPAGQAPATPKMIRVGTLKEPSTGIAMFAGSSNMSAQHIWTFHAGLTAVDAQGNLQPRIANKIPSVD